MYNADPTITSFAIYQNLTSSQIIFYINNGPIAAGMYANSGIQAYKSGIYSGCPSNSYKYLDHAIVLVGYNTTGNYYIIKNSWGTSWGQSGYGYVSMTNDCGISSWLYQFTSSSSLGTNMVYTSQTDILSTGTTVISTTFER
jgi:C1A family cysteine protease